jgi:hypothetical protein
MGRKRNPGDMLALMGHARVTRLGSAARWLLTVKHGRRGHRMTAFEIIHMVEKHPKLPESVEAFDKAHPLSPSMLAAIHLSWAGRPPRISALEANTSKTTVSPRPVRRVATATLRGPNSLRDPPQSGRPTTGKVDG